MVRTTMAGFLAAVAFAAAAHAATGEPPHDFAGIKFGASPAQLRSQYGDLRRNPDSDRDYEVLMVQNLRGAEVKSPAAFDFYQGKLVGGQIMLNSSSAGYWLQKARVQYGQPDRCDYCEYPDMATAQWKWPDGASVKVEGGGMLNVFTAEGLKARQSWIARGEGNGGHASIGGGSAVVSAPHASEPTSETKQMTEKSAHPRPPQSALQHYYGAARRRVKRWFGW